MDIMNYYRYAVAVKLGQPEEIAGIIHGCPDGIPAEYQEQINEMLESHIVIVEGA